jgi:DTW domain-containing protein YfiP
MSEEEQHRRRCYGCYRPTTHCFCDLIPSINNQTEILILQHTRERFHAFNTARIVDRALVNSRVEVGFTPDLASRQDSVSPKAGLLYPGDNARLIDDVPIADRPEQIVVLDGTWHHAKTMLRDIPWLHTLPQFRINPSSPSQYRIRREPSIDSLSTVEATVDILRAIEPNTAGLDDLLSAFNTMIDRHIAVIGTAEPRHRARVSDENRIATNIPRSLLDDANNIVVAYGESIADALHPRRVRTPLVWTAMRLGTQETFYQRVAQPNPLPKDLLSHVELTESDFKTAVPITELQERWAKFSRPDDHVFVFSKGTRKLLQSVGTQHCELLKSIDFGTGRTRTLNELLESLDIHAEPSVVPGRAGKRLANALSLIRFIRER